MIADDVAPQDDGVIRGPSVPVSCAFAVVVVVGGGAAVVDKDTDVGVGVGVGVDGDKCMQHSGQVCLCANQRAMQSR